MALKRDDLLAAMVGIFEYAKACGELADEGSCARMEFARIVNRAHNALGKPNMAKIDDWKRKYGINQLP